MAEEPNQELSMDDILSSIRSILMEDNAEQQANAQPTSPQPADEASPIPETQITEPEEDSSLLAALPQVEEPNLTSDSILPAKDEAPISVDDLPGMKDDSDDIEELNPEDEVFDLSPSMIIDDPEDKITLENPADSSEPEISEDDILNLSNLASSVQEEPKPQAQVEAAPKKVPDLHAPLAADVLSATDEKEDDMPFSLDDELDNSEEIHLDDITPPAADTPLVADTPLSEQDEESAPAPDFAIADKETLDSQLAAEEAQKKEDIKAALPPLDFDLPKVDVDAEPIFEPESQTVTDIDINQLKESIASVPETHETTAEPLAEPEPETGAIDEAMLSDILGASAQPQEPSNPEPQEQNITPQAPSSQNIDANNITSPAPMAEPVEPQTVANSEDISDSQDAADVSANIINNFAKLFAEKKAAQTEPVVEPEVMTSSVEPIKNASQSIAELVREAVVKQVTQQMDVNFETYAKEAVAAQTQAWLDANLPAIVEAVVSKEIERVMAKVGS